MEFLKGQPKKCDSKTMEACVKLMNKLIKEGRFKQSRCFSCEFLKNTGKFKYAYV